jgi:S-adenosylmethionine:tRNA ribosyltransferase-isomerase
MTAVRRTDFHYDLPEELIAQHPAEHRDQSRLLVLYRSSCNVLHKSFTDFRSFIAPGDLLILNNSKVIPARVRGFKPDTGGSVELLLLEEVTNNEWWCMLKPGKRLREGSHIRLNDLYGEPTPINGELHGKNSEGHGKVRFSGTENILNDLSRIGETPLPPYIGRESGLEESDRGRYQTVYASPPGSVAAPTAGLHFTDAALNQLRSAGVNTAFITLHVGIGTFSPVKADALSDHNMHFEQFELPAATAKAINDTKAAGHKVIAVGTTSVRVLESVAKQSISPAAGTPAEFTPLNEHDHRGKTDIFIYPPYRFRVVDHLLTNFHLPESTLLMLISAFAKPGSFDGRQTIINAYAEAIRERYRFFSYGDAMLIL